MDPGSGEEFNAAVERWLDERGIPRMRAVTYPLVVSTGAAGLRAVSAQVGLSFSVLQPALLDYARRETEFLADVMGETTGNAVARTVQAGLDEGLTVAGLRKELQGLPEFDRKRAQLVARTETTRAWNGSQRTSLSSYQSESGVQAFKVWLSSRDDRVRDEHNEIDGEQRAIDDPFSNGLMNPGEPNCRCTLLYSLADPVSPDEVPGVQEVEEVDPIERQRAITDEDMAYAGKKVFLEAENAKDYVEKFLKEAGFKDVRFVVEEWQMGESKKAGGFYRQADRTVALDPGMMEKMNEALQKFKEGKNISNKDVEPFHVLFHELTHARSIHGDKGYGTEWGRILEEGLVERRSREITTDAFGDLLYNRRFIGKAYHGEVKFFDGVVERSGEGAFDKIWKTDTLRERLEVVGKYTREDMEKIIKSSPMVPRDKKDDAIKALNRVSDADVGTIALDTWKIKYGMSGEYSFKDSGLQDFLEGQGII